MHSFYLIAAFCALLLVVNAFRLRRFCLRSPCKKISNYWMSHASVFDDVFDTSFLREMDVQAKAGGMGHTLFFRNQQVPRTAIEAGIEAALIALGDASPIVEYWWRDEWMSLEAHKDIDELRARYEGVVKYPHNAHVLYLSVGPEVRGPTVLLDERANSTSFTSLTVVPAVTNRLLRFDGNITHAVPRPALAYFDPEEGGDVSKYQTLP